jgi:uncharacterized protein (DUF433 family)
MHYPVAMTTTDARTLSADDLLTSGIYSLPDAARLTGVPIPSIRRWTLGYHFIRGGERRWSPPLVKPQLHPAGGGPALSFLDLQELRFLHAFRVRGVSWYWLRISHEKARERIGHAHPFTTGKFHSAGRSILTEVATGSRDRALENIASGQLEFKRVIAPYIRGLVFDHGVVVRWFPRRDRSIVVDPSVSFGQPIVVKGGVPTSVLAQSYRAERSVERVAKWYDVDVRSVRAAVEFERRLAA